MEARSWTGHIRWYYRQHKEDDMDRFIRIIAVALLLLAEAVLDEMDL